MARARVQPQVRSQAEVPGAVPRKVAMRPERPPQYSDDDECKHGQDDQLDGRVQQRVRDADVAAMLAAAGMVDLDGD